MLVAVRFLFASLLRTFWQCETVCSRLKVLTDHAAGSEVHKREEELRRLLTPRLLFMLLVLCVSLLLPFFFPFFPSLDRIFYFLGVLLV